MGKVTAGWRRAAFYDPDTGTTVLVSNINPAASSWDKPNITSETSTGRLFGGYNPQVTVGFMDSDDLAQLTTWAEAGTPVALAIEGLNQNVIWRRTEEIQFIRGVAPNARDGAEVHQVTMESIDVDTNEINELVNLVELNEWSGTSDTLVLPIEGATVTCAADYSGTGGNLTITARNYAGSTVGSTVQSNAAGGRISAELLLPADTYDVVIDFDASSTGGTTTNPSVRLDGGTADVAY